MPVPTKICPGCGAVWTLDTPECQRCGHKFSTSLNRTQVLMPPQTTQQTPQQQPVIIVAPGYNPNAQQPLHNFNRGFWGMLGGRSALIVIPVILLFLALVFFIGMAVLRISLTHSQSEPAASSQTEDTVGAIVTRLSRGMSNSEVTAAIGPPDNMTTSPATHQTIWTYRRGADSLNLYIDMRGSSGSGILAGVLMIENGSLSWPLGPLAPAWSRGYSRTPRAAQPGGRPVSRPGPFGGG